MATDVENTLKNAADKIGQFVANAATMTVETWYVEIGQPVAVDAKGVADFAKAAHPVARTIVRLDGDCVAIVPMRPVQGEGGARLEVDSGLLTIHERNVKTATEYRASILGALAGILKQGA